MTRTAHPFGITTVPAEPVRAIVDQQAALAALFAGYRAHLRGRPAPRSDASAEQLLAEIGRLVDGHQPIAA